MLMKESITLDVSNKKKHKFSKGFKISISILGLIALASFIYFTLDSLFYKPPAQPEYVPPVVTNIKGEEDIQILGYREEIQDYVDNISASLVLVDATFYLIDDLPTESKKYTEILHNAMVECYFSPYPYSKEDIPSTDLIKKIEILEEATDTFCNLMVENSTKMIRYYESEDAEEKFRIYEEMYDSNEEGYKRSGLIEELCDEILKMVGE